MSCLSYGDEIHARILHKAEILSLPDLIPQLLLGKIGSALSDTDHLLPWVDSENGGESRGELRCDESSAAFVQTKERRFFCQQELWEKGSKGEDAKKGHSRSTP